MRSQLWLWREQLLLLLAEWRQKRGQRLLQCRLRWLPQLRGTQHLPRAASSDAAIHIQ